MAEKKRAAANDAQAAMGHVAADLKKEALELGNLVESLKQELKMAEERAVAAESKAEGAMQEANQSSARAQEDGESLATREAEIGRMKGMLAQADAEKAQVMFII